jgi:hypothetical protein
MSFLIRNNDTIQELARDDRLSSSHMSLYLALLILWKQNCCSNPFTISRKQLMSISKIGSFTTYHKCIKQLEEFGYIKYVPSFNSFIGSSVLFVEKNH